MTINIRNIEKEDFRYVEEITREAFWNLYVPGCNEHLIVHNMRTHSDFIPELSFVIELNKKIIGSIIYSHSYVVSDIGTKYATITFGPVSILPEFQRKGYGKALILHSIAAAKKMDYRAIVIGGYPYHYKPYGFVGAKKYGISLPDKNYYTGIMALPLYDGALDSISGSIFFSEGLDLIHEEAEKFDQSFSRKVKRVQPSQDEFEKAVSEIDNTVYNNNF